MQGSFCVYAEKIGTGYAIRKRCMSVSIEQENRKERYFQMKKISILIPCYNEEEKCRPYQRRDCKNHGTDLPGYDYELVFIDNDSSDNTRPILRRLCSENRRIKAIFNAKNFGQFNSLLWNAPGNRRLRDQYGSGFSGSGGTDSTVCQRMGERL